MTHSYGWVKDSLDPRDHIFALSRNEQTTVLPDHFSLRDKMPAVYDQGQLGSCTANAIAGCVQYEQMKQKEAEGANVPSRLFIYWNERKIEGTVNYDAGAMIRDGMKVIGSIGSPPESDWPYDIEKFKLKPPSQAFTDALQYTATYGRVIQASHSLHASVYFKRPVVFGFLVYESFDNIGSDGIMPMPRVNQEQILGGHAVDIIGYKQINGHLYFECRNSWGESWGNDGYFFMPAAYAISSDYCSDFWHVNLTT
jgi:C1A family cysteine protease